MGLTLLKEYMTIHGLKAVDIAKATGRTEGTVSKWLSGQSSPDLDSAFAIQEFTNGTVPANSWLKSQNEAEEPDLAA